jgi:hypothetical protein
VTNTDRIGITLMWDQVCGDDYDDSYNGGDVNADNGVECGTGSYSSQTANPVMCTQSPVTHNTSNCRQFPVQMKAYTTAPIAPAIINQSLTASECTTGAADQRPINEINSSCVVSNKAPVVLVGKGKGRKLRQLRHNFDGKQTAILDDMFNECTHYPDLDTIRELAHKLRTTVPSVRIWFQNRRAKFRRSGNWRFSTPVGRRGS